MAMDNDDRKLSLSPTLEQVLRQFGSTLAGTSAGMIAKDIVEREIRNRRHIDQLRQEWQNKADTQRKAFHAKLEQRKVGVPLWEMRRGPVWADLIYSSHSSRCLLRVRLKKPDERIALHHIGARRFDRIPSMSQIRAGIRGILGALVRENARRHGALVGIKSLKWNGDMLVSPSYHTMWNGHMLEAPVQPAMDNRAGIYALWPRRDGIIRGREELDGYLSRGCVLVELLGSGVTVVGNGGWRAQRTVITTICCDPHQWGQFVSIRREFAHKGVEVILPQSTREESLEALLDGQPLPRRELLNWR